MKIVAGLGNPGPRYETTRHNAGFLLLDQLVDRWDARTANGKGDGDFFTASVKGEKVLLIKPLTYMNLSGQCIAPNYKFYKLNPEDLIVLHDEIDIRPATFRLKVGGGSGGHNGLKSIDSSIGTNEYARVRIGVGRPEMLPENNDKRAMSAADYVLERFDDNELQDFEKLSGEIMEAVEALVKDGPKEAMNRFNRKK